MNFESYKINFIKLANELGIEITEIKGIDCFKPIFEKIREDSSTIIIKIDGERKNNIYTFLISGKKLGAEESLRLDTSELEGGLAYICVEYAKIAWKWSDR